MMEPTTIVGIVVVSILIYIYSTRAFNVFSKLGIPGPRPWPFFGNLISFTRLGFLKFDAMLKEKYGNISGIYLGTQPFVTISDIGLLKQVMIKESNSFTDHYPFLRRPFPLNKSLTVLSGADWRRVRHAITPTFTSGKMKKMTSLILKSVVKLTSKFENAAEEAADINIKDFYGRYTMSVISDTMFGMEIAALDKENDIFIEKAKAVMNLQGRALVMFIMVFIPELRRIIEYMEWDFIDLPSANFFIDAVEKAIEERKGREHEFHDFLSLMLKAEVSEEDVNKADSKARGLTNEEILAQSLIFMIAGYETTASALTYTSFLLSKHPECQERCREEIMAEFCDDTPEQTYESLSRMPYLDQCLKESLRLYPPAPRTDRVATEDVTIGGYRIPKGTGVIIPIRLILRDPALWNEPEQFIPERFAADAEGDLGKLPFQFLTFGAGPRNCIGMRFAILEAKLALIRILKSVRLVTCEKTQNEPLNFNTFGQLKTPLFLRAERIE